MDAAISIGAKTGEYMVEPIGQQVGYLIHLNSNIKNLKDQFQKLGDKRHEVQLLIDAERMNGQVILPEVNRWVENADEIRQGLQRFIDEDVKADKKCLGGWCQDLKSCYCLGRKAEKKTQEIDAEKRKDLVIALEVEQWVQMVGNISQGLQRFIDEDKMCLDLKSRYSLSRKAKKKTLAIEKLLSDAPSLNKMSCPPPPQGIGSSSIEGFKDFESRISMIEEVLEALRDDYSNMIAICGMGGIGKTTMAKEVAKRAKDDKLFDEVVMAVVSQNQDLRKIQDIGIPYGGQHKRCKVLLTSRSEDACSQMETQKIVQINVLSKEEAWNLFREMAGNCIDSTPSLRSIAKEVAKECGALPVAIVTVARALANKTKDEWIAALEQLKKYGVGRRLFAKIDNVAEARSRVHAMIKVLTVYESEDVEYVIDATSDQTPRDAFPILESLALLHLSNLKEIYHGQFLERSFSGAQLACFGNLTSLHLDACHRLKNVFSLSIARGLVQLQELDITSCTDMEEIFSKEGQDEKAFDMIKFPQLKLVTLENAPSLIGFCTFVDPIELVQPSHAKGTQPILNQEDVITEFQHEQHHTGTFPQSGPISNKFLSSIAKLLVMLEEIQVIDCQEIEEILARAREEEGEEKDIVLFNKVNSLVLMDLPNLKCFCNEANALEWPSLKKVGVIRCPNLRTFVPANIKTPELEGVYEDYRYDDSFYKFEFKEHAQWKGDLNATIEHIFKGKELKVDYETPQQQTETNEKNMLCWERQIQELGFFV
uniref:Uncharacterized protein n=1 Tax=Fagus sylvatica TaxID=28930 RepID=A0A2N9G551_FAGSY